MDQREITETSGIPVLEKETAGSVPLPREEFFLDFNPRFLLREALSELPLPPDNSIFPAPGTSLNDYLNAVRVSCSLTPVCALHTGNTPISAMVDCFFGHGITLEGFWLMERPGEETMCDVILNGVRSAIQRGRKGNYSQNANCANPRQPGHITQG